MLHYNPRHVSSINMLYLGGVSISVPFSSEPASKLWARIVQSVERRATGWTVRGSNPDGVARIFSPVQTGPGPHTASYKMDTRSLPGVKWPGRGVDHPLPSSAEVKKE
jgi:hypothetical protein